MFGFPHAANNFTSPQSGFGSPQASHGAPATPDQVNYSQGQSVNLSDLGLGNATMEDVANALQLMRLVQSW
jgi:hypothetical protein